MKTLETGLYQHYKGGKYLVLGVAKHSETLEDLVVYVALHDNEKANLWVRPMEMFFELVELDGKRVERFTKIQS